MGCVKYSLTAALRKLAKSIPWNDCWYLKSGSENITKPSQNVHLEMYIINEFQFIQMHIHALHLLNWKHNIPEISLWKLLQVKGFICKWGYMQVTLSWKHLPFIEKKYTCTNIIHQLYADNTPPSRFAVLFVYQRFLFIYTYLAIRFIKFCSLQLSTE